MPNGLLPPKPLPLQALFPGTLLLPCLTSWLRSHIRYHLPGEIWLNTILKMASLWLFPRTPYCFSIAMYHYWMLLNDCIFTFSFSHLNVRSMWTVALFPSVPRSLEQCLDIAGSQNSLLMNNDNDENSTGNRKFFRTLPSQEYDYSDQRGDLNTTALYHNLRCIQTFPTEPRSI